MSDLLDLADLTLSDGSKFSRIDPQTNEPYSKKGLKKAMSKAEKVIKANLVKERLERERLAREAADFARDNYGTLPLNQSQSNECSKDYLMISDPHALVAGTRIKMIARAQNARNAGKQAFIEFRQRFNTIQGIMSVDEETISKEMIKFACGVNKESIVLIEGIVQSVEEQIQSCTIGDFEIKVEKFWVMDAAHPKLPLTLEDASRSEEEIQKAAENGQLLPRVQLETRLNARIIDLRTQTNQAIFKLQAKVCKYFRQYLDDLDFTEIHSPKLLEAASEGGAEAFKVSYFKKFAYLAQSPQFFKQMAMCADFEKVYEIAPVFRAEKSFTHRHMTEYTSMDLEMSFKTHYHEVMLTIGNLFNHIFKQLKSECTNLLGVISNQFPVEDFEFLPEPLVLEWPQAIQLLRDNDVEIDDYADLSTEKERVLGGLVKEKYKTDFFILDKYPLEVRPFYTMPCPHNPKLSNSYDMFMRGEEVLSGAQRVHNYDLLIERLQFHGVDPESMRGYVDSFKYGVPTHAGGAIGLERVVMLFCGLGNIRKTSLFPRDPIRLFP